jgi:hypothetical protein
MAAHGSVPVIRDDDPKRHALIIGHAFSELTCSKLWREGEWATRHVISWRAQHMSNRLKLKIKHPTPKFSDAIAAATETGALGLRHHIEAMKTALDG